MWYQKWMDEAEAYDVKWKKVASAKSIHLYFFFSTVFLFCKVLWGVLLFLQFNFDNKLTGTCDLGVLHHSGSHSWWPNQFWIKVFKHSAAPPLTDSSESLFIFACMFVEKSIHECTQTALLCFNSQNSLYPQKDNYR